MVQLSTALVGGVVMKRCRFAVVAAALCIVATSSTAMSAIVDRAPTDFPSNSNSTINDTAIVRPSMLDAAANGTGAHTRTHTQPTPDRLTQAARPKRVDVHAHQNGNYPVPNPVRDAFFYFIYNFFLVDAPKTAYQARSPV